MNFMEYIAYMSNERRYIAVVYDDETQDRLRSWAEDNGFDLSFKFDGSKQSPDQFDFHTTVFYSETTHPELDYGFYDLDEYIGEHSGEARVVGFELLGQDNDIPVFKIESEQISKLRRYFEVNHHMEDKWPSFKPHVSVSYRRSPEYKVDNLPDFPLTFQGFKIDEVKY